MKKHKALKFDDKKPELDLIPYCALKEAAKAAMMGKLKYGKYNYKEGMEWTRLANASLRHIREFLDGNDINIEKFQHIETKEELQSRCHHLGHAIINLAFLLDYVYNDIGVDDRYVKKD